MGGGDAGRVGDIGLGYMGDLTGGGHVTGVQCNRGKHTGVTTGVRAMYSVKGMSGVVMVAPVRVTITLKQREKQ